MHGGDVAVIAVAVTCAIHTTIRMVIPSAFVAVAVGDVVAAVVVADVASMPIQASSGYPEASFHRQNRRAFDNPSYPIYRVCKVDTDRTSSVALDEVVGVGTVRGV